MLLFLQVSHRFLLQIQRGMTQPPSFTQWCLCDFWRSVPISPLLTLSYKLVDFHFDGLCNLCWRSVIVDFLEPLHAFCEWLYETQSPLRQKRIPRSSMCFFCAIDSFYRAAITALIVLWMFAPLRYCILLVINGPECIPSHALTWSVNWYTLLYAYFQWRPGLVKTWLPC